MRIKNDSRGKNSPKQKKENSAVRKRTKKASKESMAAMKASVKNGGVKAPKEAKQPDEYEKAVIDYNLAYTEMSDAGVELFRQRERTIDLLGHVGLLVNSIANRPKSFDSDLGEVYTRKKAFKEAAEFAEAELNAARKSTAGVGVGVATGMAVASVAPTAAMWVATTFGTASTGTAISTLSGAAASQAALAWLGGGALTAGGGGTAAGSALLALAGPIGWSIAGATLLASIVLFAKRRFDIRDAKQKELTAVKKNTEHMKELVVQTSALLEKTVELRNRLSESFDECMALFGADFLQLNQDNQDRLAAMVNNALSLSKLLGEIIGQEGSCEERGDK